MIKMLLSGGCERVKEGLLTWLASCTCKLMLGGAGGYEYCYIEDIVILEQLFNANGS